MPKRENNTKPSPSPRADVQPEPPDQLHLSVTVPARVVVAVVALLFALLVGHSPLTQDADQQPTFSRGTPARSDK
jgi:hypothetical protein